MVLSAFTHGFSASRTTAFTQMGLLDNHSGQLNSAPRKDRRWLLCTFTPARTSRTSVGTPSLRLEARSMPLAGPDHYVDMSKTSQIP
eukprot:9404554-Pyramimonas_sp.AAC.1